MNINNPKIWTLTDGSQGMISQTRGLAFELGKNIAETKTDVFFHGINYNLDFYLFINGYLKINYQIVIQIL